MDRLQAMKIFERVVEEGGFAAAARAMDMSPPWSPAWWPSWSSTWAHACCSAPPASWR